MGILNQSLRHKAQKRALEYYNTQVANISKYNIYIYIYIYVQYSIILETSNQLISISYSSTTRINNGPMLLN